MTDHGAFEDEMRFRTLSDRDAERLLGGRDVGDPELDELAEVARSLRTALAAPPAQDRDELVRRLAATARAAGNGAPTTPARSARSRRAAAPRLRTLARVAGAVALIPLLFAGLALADVTLPTPARKAFEAVGVTLPNQPDEAESPAGGGEEGGATEPGDDGAEGAKPAGNSKDKLGGPDAGVRGQGTTKPNPARAGGRANGEQGRGRALGKRGLAPGRLGPPGQTRAPGQTKKDASGKAAPGSGKPPAKSAQQPTPPKPKAVPAPKQKPDPTP